jgi:hypothetical protein
MSLLGIAGSEVGSSINEYLRTGTGDVVRLGLSKLPDDKLDPNEALAVHSQMMKNEQKIKGRADFTEIGTNRTFCWLFARPVTVNGTWRCLVP